jgi:hypothetical protein
MFIHESGNGFPLFSFTHRRENSMHRNRAGPPLGRVRYCAAQENGRNFFPCVSEACSELVSFRTERPNLATFLLLIESPIRASNKIRSATGLFQVRVIGAPVMQFRCLSAAGNSLRTPDATLHRARAGKESLKTSETLRRVALPAPFERCASVNDAPQPTLRYRMDAMRPWPRNKRPGLPMRGIRPAARTRRPV